MITHFFIGYHPFKGYYCGGQKIYEWEDKSTANNGHDQFKGLSTCEHECSKHPECKAFERNNLRKICGYWIKGPLQLTKDSTNDKDCHIKKEGKSEYQISLSQNYLNFLIMKVYHSLL